MAVIRAVIFDWGGTLMDVLPDMWGPMADWPRVEVGPGAVEALTALHGRYVIAVASNATESDAATVRRALARGGIDSLVDHVFTAHDLRVAKPHPTFFHTILEQIGVEAASCVMVGDDYVSDVAGAKRVGMGTVWLDAAAASRPGRPPEADAVIGSLADLPAVIARFDSSVAS
jgi:putative hydrolase of the HAD superfamily